MYIPLQFLDLIDLVEECKRLRKILQEIEKTAKKTNEDNFEVQSKLIAARCKEALKNKSYLLSRTKKELLEGCESHIESIISGEYMEQFEDFQFEPIER